MSTTLFLQIGSNSIYIFDDVCFYCRCYKEEGTYLSQYENLDIYLDIYIYILKSQMKSVCWYI